MCPSATQQTYSITMPTSFALVNKGLLLLLATSFLSCYFTPPVQAAQSLLPFVEPDVHNQPLNDPAMSEVIPTTTKGSLHLGDGCDSFADCDDLPGAFCDLETGTCTCLPTHPVAGGTMCGKEMALNETCLFSGQCRTVDSNSECRHKRCACSLGYRPFRYETGQIWCIENEAWEPGTYVDPTMIGVLAGLALMFVILCVVLRLFSKSRFGENRSIFNTPNPRLANVSLLKETKETGRRASLRPPSRQTSVNSLPRSPNGSTGRRPSHDDATTPLRNGSASPKHVAIEMKDAATKV